MHAVESSRTLTFLELSSSVSPALQSQMGRDPMVHAMRHGMMTLLILPNICSDESGER